MLQITELKAVLTLHVSDVILYLTLNLLFNRISSPFIIENNESVVQKQSASTVRVHVIPLWMEAGQQTQKICLTDLHKTRSKKAFSFVEHVFKRCPT